MKERSQVIYADVMHIDGFKFLISVVEPLQLTIQVPLENEMADQLGLALQGHLSLLRARGFQPTIVYIDPQSGFRALKNLFPGVLIDDGGASDYVPKVDAKIKCIKELYRAVKNGLPWKLPAALVKHLVCYAVGRINLRRTSSLSSNLSPYRLFTGTRINYRKSLQLAFGDYAEVFDGSDNTSRSRTIPCIALHPCNNSTGSWEFLNLVTGNGVRRSNWKKMVTTQIIIDKINSMTAEEATNQEQQQPVNPPQLGMEATPSATVKDQSVESQTPEETVEITAEETSEVPETGIEEVPTIRRSVRIAGGITQPERYLLLTKIQHVTRQLTVDKEKAKLEALQKEILQIFEELQAITPVLKAEVPKDAEILRCFIFLVEKFLANGQFDKIKARLVANGAQQKREMYPNKSSPTANIHSIFACLTLAAYIGNYKVAKIDVKGAYIQTEITGSPIYMKLDKKLTTMALEILPSLKNYVTSEGTLYTKLMKALYGCVQSGQLWYAKIKKVLRREGYIATPTDQCIFRKVSGLVLCILMLYVDDILLFADDEEVNKVEKFMKKEFKWITVDKGNIQSYLGMNIRVEKHQIMIDMSYYTQQLLEEFQNSQNYTTPAIKECFTTSSSPMLDENGRKRFHTVMVKLLYLAKRARPDILTSVSFLCTKVTKPTKADQQKLLRVIGYLKQTVERTYIIKPMKPL
jgi:hypothetical protein